MGVLNIYNHYILRHCATGIHVQLEADLYLKFTSQNGRNVYRKRTCILQNTLTKPNGDQLSPIRHDVVPPVPEGKDVIVVILPEGRNVEICCENFLFTLVVPGEVLPAPFKNAYGSLTYKVVAYMRSIYGRYVQIGEKTLAFDGYQNLTENVDALKPLKIKRGLMDVSASVQAILILESGAYLPQETAPFTMVVRNPGCIPLQITVFIVQKITYSVDSTPLSACQRVDQVELFESAPEADTCWKGILTVPKGQIPSYIHANPCYEVRYAVQFKVHVENHGTIKGTAPLLIGTTRERVEILKQTVNSLQVPVNPWGERRGSSSSIKSENSFSRFRHRKKVSLPSYSQLNSPVRSIESCK